MKKLFENWNKYLEGAESDSIAQDDETRTWQEHSNFKDAVEAALERIGADWATEGEYGWGDIVIPTSIAQREAFIEELEAFTLENTGESLADLGVTQ